MGKLKAVLKRLSEKERVALRVGIRIQVEIGVRAMTRVKATGIVVLVSG